MRFDFTGVAVAYFATKGTQRGVSLLTIDSDYSKTYTIDLVSPLPSPLSPLAVTDVLEEQFSAAGYDDGEELIWYSGTLPYGSHNITISQITADARLGCVAFFLIHVAFFSHHQSLQSLPLSRIGELDRSSPDLAWYAFPSLPSFPFLLFLGSHSPTAALYTLTEARPTPTYTDISFSKPLNVGAIAGGAVGGVLACLLAGFFLYLWRREKARQRIDAANAVAARKSEEHDGAGSREEKYAPYGGEGSRGGRDDFSPFYQYTYAAYPYAGHYGYPPPSSAYPSTSYAHPPPSDYPPSSVDAPNQNLYPYPQPPSRYPQPQPPPPTSLTTAYQPPPQSLSAASSSDRPPPVSALDSAYHSGSASEQEREYPMHLQGSGRDQRSYPVPEL